MGEIQIRRNHAIAFVAWVIALIALFALLGAGWPPSIWTLLFVVLPLTIASLSFRTEYRRDPRTAMCLLAVLSALPLQVSIATAIRESSDARVKALVTGALSALLLGVAVRFVLKHKREDGVPSVLREIVPGLPLFENDDVHWGFLLAGSMREKQGGLHLYLENCLDAPRSIDIRVVSEGLLWSYLLHDRGRLRLTHKLELAPLEVGDIRLPLEIRPGKDRPIVFSVEVRAKGVGRRLRQRREALGKREMGPIWVALGMLTQVSAEERGNRWVFPVVGPQNLLPDTPPGIWRRLWRAPSPLPSSEP